MKRLTQVNRRSLMDYLILFYFLLYPFTIPTSLGAMLPFETYGKSLSWLYSFFLVVVILLQVIAGKEKLDRRFVTLVGMSLLLVLYSILISFIVSGLSGYEMPTSHTYTQGIYLIYFFVLIGVSHYCYKRISKKWLRNVLKYYAILYLVIFAFQWVATRNDAVLSLYNSLNSEKIFEPSLYFNGVQKRLSGFLTEPSYVGGFVVAILMTYFFFSWILRRKRGDGIIFNLLFASAFLTLSSATYVILAFHFVCILIIFTARRDIRTIFFREHSLYCFVLVVAAIIGVIVKSEDITALFYKVGDLQNMSTAYRFSTIFNALNIFRQYPLGIGQGNAGYFYNEIAYLVSGSNSFEVQSALEAGADGAFAGAFFASTLSSFGLIGILICAYLFVRCFQVTKYEKNTIMKYFLRINLVLFLVDGFINAGILGSLTMPFIFGLFLECWDCKQMAYRKKGFTSPKVGRSCLG